MTGPHASRRVGDSGHAALAWALTLAWLAACAAPPAKEPAAPPPDLATVLAPETPRPAMVAPLTALLRGGVGEVLLPLGQDTLRCEFAASETLARVTCDGETEEANSAPALVKKLHTGDLQVRVLQHRLDDTTLFRERTGLAPEVPMFEPQGSKEQGRYLDDELGHVRFEVGERGEVVRARYQGLDGEEVIEAGSLLALGQRLRERRVTLTAERLRRHARGEERQRIATVFRTLQAIDRAGAGRWMLEGVVAGVPEVRQPLLRGALSAGQTPVGEVWPARWRSAELTLAHGMAPGWQSRLVWVESFDGQVTSVTSRGHWRDRRATSEPIDCAAHDAWIAEHAPGMVRRSERTSARCEWRLRSGDDGLDLTLDAEHIELTARWQPDRLEAREREAARTLAERAHRAACTRCAATRQRFLATGPDQRSALDRYRIVGVDMKRCTMRIVALGETDEQDMACD